MSFKKPMMALLLASMIGLLMVPLPTMLTNAQTELTYVPSGTTEYPWTYKYGHVSDKGAYQGWSYSEGPGPLTNHILWMAPGAGAPRFCFDGRVWAGKYCFDAATGDVIWYNPAGAVSGTAGWIPKDIQVMEGWDTWGFGPFPKALDDQAKDKADGFCYYTGSTLFIEQQPGIPGEWGHHNVIRASLATGDVAGTSSMQLGGRYGTPLLYYTYYADYNVGMFPFTATFLRIYDIGNSPSFFECYTTGTVPVYGLPGGINKLWDTWMISDTSTPTEYKIVLGNNGTWITAQNVCYYENGTMDYLKRYENRHAGSGCISPIFSEDGIMYGINGHWRVFYNESYTNPVTGHWEPMQLKGGGPLPWNVPYGESIGAPELLNIGGGTIVYCDWDYSTMYGEYGTPTDAYGVTRSRDSEGFLLAINMTDGTLLWKRVCSMGCYDPIVDPEKNLLWSTAGSYTKCYDATTGEDKWMFVNPTLKEAGEHSAYDGAKIYHNFWDGNAYAVDAETGDIIWGPVYTDGFYSCGGAPVVSGESNLVYLNLNKMKQWRQPTTEPGLVVALDADTGDIVWQLDGWKDGGWFSGAVPVLADGRLYVGEASARANLVCIGAGPTKTTVNLSSEQLKAGDTVLISGQLLDQSPESSGNFNAPCSDCSVTLMYCPLGGLECNTISTVTTGYAGDYYYEWTVPSNMTGMYSILASYAGDNPSYIESSGQANFRVGEAGLSQAEMEQVTAAVPDYSIMFYAVIAAVIITLALVVFMLFRKK